MPRGARWSKDYLREEDFYADMARAVQTYHRSELGLQAARDATTVQDELRDGPLTVSELAEECGLHIDRVRAALVYARQTGMAEPMPRETGTWRRLET